MYVMVWLVFLSDEALVPDVVDMMLDKIKQYLITMSVGDNN